MKIDITFPNRRIQTILNRLLQAGLRAADPALAIRRVVNLQGNILRVGRRRYNLRRFDRIIVVGAGKASGIMAMALERQLGKRVDSGLVVVKSGYGLKIKKVRVLEASHPVPDRRSEQAARKLVKLLRSLTPRDLLMVLLSGGASSLVAAPASGLTLREKQQTTKWLLRSGATIQEVNTVRKHLSAIKGGQFAAAAPATVITLVLSDVLGDDLATIGSGLTAPDPTTFHQAQKILNAYKLWNRVPVAVRSHLEKGVKGKVLETPKPGAAIFHRVHHEVIGNNQLAVKSVAVQAKAMGLCPVIRSTTLQGEARKAGEMIGEIARKIHTGWRPAKRPACIIWGGELTVTVTGKGKGGRAQEMALSAARTIAGLPKIYVAGFGTDGIDGPTGAAGAIVDGETVNRALKKKVDPDQALVRHDSYTFFKQVGGHIVTGPTGTNVNDLYLIIAP